MNTVRIRVAAIGAVASIFFIGCPNPPPPTSGDKCGSEVCGEGQLCDPATQLCVADVAPEVTIDQPVAGALLTGDSVEVAGTVTDDAGKLAKTEVSIEGGDWAEVTVGDDGKFTATVPLPKLDKKGAKLRVRAFDELEQEGVADLDLSVDNVAPICTFIAPQDGALIGPADAPALEVKYELGDGSMALKTASITIDGTAAPLFNETGPGTYSWNLDAADDGATHVLALHAEDPSGHVCDLQVTVQVDLIAPALSLTAPAEMPDPLVVGGPGVDTLAFAGVASDGSPQRPVVTIDFDDGQGPREVEWATEEGTDFALELPLELEDSKEHQVQIRAQDQVGNATVISRTIVVDRVAPVLAITAPTNGQNFNIAAMNGGEFVVVTWDVSDGSGAPMTSARILPGTTFTPATDTFPVQTLATDNGKGYEVEVSSTDAMGNTTVQSVTFNVDRLAPKIVSGVPPTNTRMLAPSMTLTFNEPVTFQSGVTMLTPSVTMPTQTATTFTFPLTNYQIYTATFPSGLVLDAFGNPNASATSSTFHTEPATPDPATFALALGTNSQDYKRFDAIADEDGIVSIVFRNTNNFVELGEIDPKSGAYVALDSRSSQSIASVSMSSHRELGPTPPATVSLSPLRRRGYAIEEEFQLPGGFVQRSFLAVWADESGAITQQSPASEPAVVVPVPAGCADQAGDSFAYIDASGVLRRTTPTGNYLQNSPLATPVGVAPHARNAWMAQGYDSSGELRVAERRCTCANPPFSSFCGFGPTYQLGSLANSSGDVVVPGNGKFAVTTYHDPAPTSDFEWCVPLCNSTSPTICSAKTPLQQQQTLNSNLRISRHLNPNKLLGARRNVSGVLELIERDISTGCFDDVWSVVATAPTSVSTAATIYKPLMFGKKPGVLYLDNTSTLRVWIP